MSFLKSIGFALAGLSEMVLRHRNFRLQAAVGIIAAIAGFFAGLSYMEWAALVLASGLVLTAEMANSAVESVVDLITIERRLQARQAKDIAAGMVLLASGFSVVIGILIFAPRITRFL